VLAVGGQSGPHEITARQRGLPPPSNSCCLQYGSVRFSIWEARSRRCAGVAHVYARPRHLNNYATVNIPISVVILTVVRCYTEPLSGAASKHRLDFRRLLHSRGNRPSRLSHYVVFRRWPQWEARERLTCHHTRAGWGLFTILLVTVCRRSGASVGWASERGVQGLSFAAVFGTHRVLGVIGTLAFDDKFVVVFTVRSWMHCCASAHATWTCSVARCSAPRLCICPQPAYVAFPDISRCIQRFTC
jgi:hypothetical protein